MVVFHGGEPLLFPKRRFITLQDKLRAIEKRTGCVIQRGVTTNAILIDREWTEIFKTYEVLPSVSIDGPAEIHEGTSKNISLWCDDQRSSLQRGRSFNPWPLIEAA
jgi:sulfatase maturation enzyme AslB (radical SAM superfamily)